MRSDELLKETIGLIRANLEGTMTMRVDDILDETIELIIANMNGGKFKDIGALRKSQYQHAKGEDAAFLRSDMYKGCKWEVTENVKKGREKQKAKTAENDEGVRKASKKRAEWYKDPKNRAKFEKKIKERDKKRLEKKKAEG